MYTGLGQLYSVRVVSLGGEMSDTDAATIFAELQLDPYGFSDGELRLVNDHWGVYNQFLPDGSHLIRVFDATTTKGRNMYQTLSAQSGALAALVNAPGHGILGSEGPLAQGLTTATSLILVALAIFLYLEFKKR